MSGAPGRMDARETAAAVAVAVVWGLTFIAIKRGVAEIPPLMFSALRFLFAAVPAAFFLRPPKAAAWRVVAYGIVLGVGQFGLLFLAIRAGMPASLSAVVVQSQAFFTVALAAPLLGERPTPMQAIGGAVSLAGIVTMSIDRLGGASIGPFVMVVGGAFCWAIANVLAKGAARDGGGRVDMFAFVVWSSLAAPAPLFALSYAVEGRGAFVALAHTSFVGWICVAVVAYGATIFGFGLWSWLMSRHSAATVGPFSLLVPVVGVVGSMLAFGESMKPLEVAGASLVLSGLALGLAPAPRALAAKFSGSTP